MIVIEYAPQVAAVSTASPSPTTLPEKPPEPEATKATPMIETTVAIQNELRIRSSPITVANAPMKIGVAARKSVTVAAVVLSTA